MDNLRFAYDKRANFELYLKLKGFVEHRMPRDNNCFFHSIAATLEEDYSKYVDELSSEERESKQKQLRQQVFDHLTKNPNFYKDFFIVPGNDVMSEEELNDALKLQMRQILNDGYWGGHASIVACSEIFNKQIIVEKPLGIRHSITPRDATNGTIYLAHVRDETHYNLLEKMSDAPNPDPQVVALFFDQLLKLQNFEFVLRNYSERSLVEVLSYAFTLNGQNTDMLKENFMIWLDKQAQKKVNSVITYYLPKMKQRHAQDFKNSGPDDNHKTVNRFVKKMLENPTIDQELLIELSTEVFGQAVTVHRPLDAEINYKYNEGGLHDPVHLALYQDGYYSVVKKTTQQKENGEDEDEVIIIDSEGTNADKQTVELLFIKGNVLRNVKSEINVLFLVYGSFDDETLLGAVEKNPEFIGLLVAYNNDDLIKIKGDIEVQQNFTVYHRKFSIPLNLDLKKRVQRMASFLIPPLFWMVNKMKTWNGVPYRVFMKYSVNSFPVILLKSMWPTVKDNVLADVNKLLQSNHDLLCRNCTGTCELLGVQCHFDASEFSKLDDFHSESVNALKKYTIFSNDEKKTLPPVMEEIRKLNSDPEPDNAEKLVQHLDNTNRDKHTWNTYMVLHLDGENMAKYPREVDNYYEMMKDPQIHKSLYVGKTTNAVFRWSHFVATTSLSQVFTKTSRLFLLRAEKFLSPDLADMDEAMMIEVIITWMRSWRKRKRTTDFLILNVREEYMPLLAFAGTSEPNLWAEFALSDVHVINFSKDDTKEFEKLAKFRGNFKKIRELEFVNGNFLDRTFASLKDVYAMIRARQP